MINILEKFDCTITFFELNRTNPTQFTIILDKFINLDDILINANANSYEYYMTFHNLNNFPIEY